MNWILSTYLKLAVYNTKIIEIEPLTQHFSSYRNTLTIREVFSIITYLYLVITLHFLYVVLLRTTHYNNLPISINTFSVRF